MCYSATSRVTGLSHFTSTICCQCWEKSHIYTVSNYSLHSEFNCYAICKLVIWSIISPLDTMQPADLFVALQFIKKSFGSGCNTLLCSKLIGFKLCKSLPNAFCMYCCIATVARYVMSEGVSMYLYMSMWPKTMTFCDIWKRCGW